MVCVKRYRLINEVLASGVWKSVRGEGGVDELSLRKEEKSRQWVLCSAPCAPLHQE